MSEEEFLNRMINQISKVFDGRIATKMKNIYLKKDKQLNKYKKILDKIKEYITTRTPSDIGISGNKPKKYYTLSEDEVDYILELLEEIE